MTDSTSSPGTSHFELVTRNPRQPFVLSLLPFTSAETDPQRCGFWGRATLIAQLQPALLERIEFGHPVAAMHWRQVLRTWWRFLDRAEVSSPGRTLQIETLSDLSDSLGLLAAGDPHIDPHVFWAFQELASDARKQAGLEPLRWEGRRTTYREVPPRGATRGRRPAA